MSETFEVKHEPYRRSQQIGGLMKQLATAQSEMQPIRKNKRNPEKGNKYADLAEVLEVTEILNKHGIAVLQFPDAEGAQVSVTTMLAHGEEWIDSTLHIVSMKTIKGGEQIHWGDPQGVGSGISYARRYALQSILALATEDDDGEKAAKQFNQSRAEAKQMQQQIAQQRISEENSRVQQMPRAVESAVAKKLREEPDKFKRLAIFQEMKKDMEEYAGEEGLKAYANILGSVGVEHSNQFKNLADAIKAAVAMEAYIKEALAKADAKAEREMEAQDAQRGA